MYGLTSIDVLGWRTYHQSGSNEELLVGQCFAHQCVHCDGLIRALNIGGVRRFLLNPSIRPWKKGNSRLLANPILLRISFEGSNTVCQ